MSKTIGDLYWNQLSMCDFSKKENVDKYNEGGFHYELYIVTDVVGAKHYKARNVKWEEITEDYLGTLTPKKGCHWDSVMGNRMDLVYTLTPL